MHMPCCPLIFLELKCEILLRTLLCSASETPGYDTVIRPIYLFLNNMKSQNSARLNRSQSATFPATRSSRTIRASTTSDARPELSERLKDLYPDGVFVVGAGGRSGKEVVSILSNSSVPVRALVRDVAKAQSQSGQNGVEYIKGDVTQFSTLSAAVGESKAMIIASGCTDLSNPLGPFEVDYQGNLNLIALAKQRGVKKIVLITSIGTDDLANFLNLAWGICFWKKRAEEELQRSGISFTIVRPGGLKDQLRAGEVKGNIVMRPAGHFGAPPVLRKSQETAGSVLRSQVAATCVAALVEPSAEFKVVEIISKPDAPSLSFEEMFSSVQ